MNLTNYQRVAKLGWNLIKNPQYIIPYVRHNIFYKGIPMGLNLPWWSYKAIEYVDTIVQNKKIFEYGTGGSTVRFAKAAKSITAVEDNKEWAEIMNEYLKKQDIKNVEIKYEYFDFKKSDNFINSSYLLSIGDEDYDIVIIDGQDETFQERIICFHHTDKSRKPGQHIIVDDFWRYEQLLENNHAKEVKVFESVGPCRYGVTSTAVFIY